MKTLLLSLLTGIHLFGVVAQAASPSDVIFVVMGGRTSCGSQNPVPTGQGMYVPFVKLLKDLKSEFRGKRFHYLVSCLNTSAPPNGEAEFITSDEPTITRSGNADYLFSEVQKLSVAKGDPAIFVIGHSYGGWVAMYLSEKLSGKEKFDALFTVDPIGPKCGPSQVIFGSAACHSAPDDLDNLAIKNHTGRWLNFFQTQDSWLTSSAIAEAENQQIVSRGPHSTINNDPRTWATIDETVKKALK